MSSKTSKVFVLVHGAWHGGWCWQRVANRLMAQGHSVHTPTLTGLCDRSHLLSPSIGLDTHAADIANLVKWHRLSDIVLVGHSYGGMVITEAAAAIGPKIGTFVLLDAFYPEAGDALVDLAAPRTGEAVASAVRAGRAVIDPIPAAVFGVNEADRDLVDGSCTPHPIKTMTDKISAAGVVARENVASKTYIRAGSYPSIPFDAGLSKAKANPGWETHVVASGHDVMLDAPDKLMEILLAVA